MEKERVVLIDKLIKLAKYMDIALDCNIPLGLVFKVDEDTYYDRLFSAKPDSILKFDTYRTEPIDKDYIYQYGDRDLYKPDRYYALMDKFMYFNSKSINDGINKLISEIKLNDDKLIYDITISFKGIEMDDVLKDNISLDNLLEEIVDEYRLSFYDEEKEMYESITVIDLINYALNNHQDIDLSINIYKMKLSLLGKKKVLVNTKYISHIFSTYFKGVLNEKLDYSEAINPIIKDYKNSINIVRNKLHTILERLELLIKYSYDVYEEIPEDYRDLESIYSIINLLMDEDAKDLSDAIEKTDSYSYDEDIDFMYEIEDIEEELIEDYPEYTKDNVSLVEDLVDEFIEINELYYDEDDFVLAYKDYKY